MSGRIRWERVSASRLDGYVGKIVVVRMELESAVSGALLASLLWLLPGVSMRPDSRFSLCTGAQEAAERAFECWLRDVGVLDG